MDRTLFLIFNHALTALQAEDARASLGAGRIVDLPPNLKELWSQIPPELGGVGDYIAPVRRWLADAAVAGDYALIQGDFGACYLMVRFAFEIGVTPVYSTTVRQAEEEHAEDGSVKLAHRFKHKMFRKYGE